MEDAPESDCGTLQIPSSGQKPPSRPHLLPELVLVVMEHLAASGLKRTLLRLMLADRACYALGTPPLLRYLRLRETFRGFEAFAGALSSPGKFAHVRRLTLSRHPCHALLSILSRTTGLEAVSLEAPCATSAAVLGLLSLSPTLRDLRCAMPDFAPPGTTTVFLYPELSSKLRSVRVPAWARDAFLLQPPPNLLDAEIRDASGCDRAALARIRDLGRLETLCLWHAPTSALSACGIGHGGGRDNGARAGGGLCPEKLLKFPRVGPQLGRKGLLGALSARLNHGELRRPAGQSDRGF
ncbi:hypothetical protein DFJ74DRAFT_669082 [Hyaloraphidium curvatum]|nr:hypothetical protein DFJ74DRAFT_669082 [Hyaloraphidium curvatum]